MKKLKLFFISAVILFSVCSCSEEEYIETMFYEELLTEEYTDIVTEPVTYNISEMLENHSRREIPETTASTVTAKTAVTVQTTTAAAASTAEKTTSAAATTAEKTGDFVCIDVPFISQREEYPTGCELVSASMLLKFYGFDATAGELIEKGCIKQSEVEYDGNKIYLDDPNKAFIGNPRSDSGYGCYAPALLDCLDKYLEDEYFDAVNLSEISLPDLCMEYIDFGEPVIIWGSINMGDTKIIKNAWTIKDTNKNFDWIANEHCLVLVGYDDENYYFNDPLKNAAVPYKKETAEKRYKELGSQAVTIRPW